MAIERNVTDDDNVFTGEDKVLSGIVYQSDGTTAQNITGWAMSWMLKKRATDSDANAKIVKTTGNGIDVVSAAAGTYTVTLTDTNLTIPAGHYYHEVKRTDDGSETVLTHGTFLVKQGVHS